MKTALYWLTHPRDALCDWGLWVCQLHLDGIAEAERELEAIKRGEWL